MEINFIELSELKAKFGNLLSYLYFDVHLGKENITMALVESNILDLLEENNLNRFMHLSNEEIAIRLFPGIQLSRNEGSYIDEFFWSGIQYMNIFLNYRIPLRTIILLLPVEDMVKKYEIYHQMNEIELCKDFIDHEYCKKSILKIFRERRNVSTRQLSLLSNIPEPTIKRLEASNNNLYNASSNTIQLLSTTLGIDSTFLKRKSSFLPFTYSTLNNSSFMTSLSIVIGRYFLKKECPNIEVKYYKRKDLDKGMAYLFVEGSNVIYYDGKDRCIDDYIFRKMLDITVDEYIKENLKINLVF